MPPEDPEMPSAGSEQPRPLATGSHGSEQLELLELGQSEVASF